VPPINKILIYEPRTEGHHPGWLAFIVEDLLSTGVRLSLAVDLRPSSKAILQDHLRDMWSVVETVDVGEAQSTPCAWFKWRSLQKTFVASGATQVFCCAFDELASNLFRCASIGWNPLANFSGRIGGIYHRPRFLGQSRTSLGRLMKRRGFYRLLGDGFFRQLLMLDEFLVSDLQQSHPKAPLFFLPDPCPDDFQGDSRLARDKLGLPPAKKMLLFFGVGSRRKGLGVAVDAMLALPADSDVLLFVAGQQQLKGALKNKLQDLVRQRRAMVLDRYVSSDEEKWCFQAADAVLLPYLNHFGTSGVLSRAAATNKFIIASDEQLVGRLVRENGLGSVFKSGDPQALASAICDFERLDQAKLLAFGERIELYTRKYSRAAFRMAILRSLALDGTKAP